MAKMATGSREEALDIVQESMLKLVQRYGGRDESEWQPLFYRILQSKIRDWYRRSRVRNRWRVWFSGDVDDDVIEPHLRHGVETQTPQPDQHLGGVQLAAQLEGALQQLPLRQQQAFLLRAWEGMDVKQTATAMGCSAGSVKTHYSRAVHRMRELLGHCWEEER